MFCHGGFFQIGWFYTTSLWTAQGGFTENVSSIVITFLLLEKVFIFIFGLDGCGDLPAFW